MKKALVMMMILGIAFALAAQAQEEKVDVAKAMLNGKHCVGFLEPAQSLHKVSRLVSFNCYKSYSEAMYEATDGWVRLPEATSPEDAVYADVEALSYFTKASGDYLLATDYNWTGYNTWGGTISWFGGTDCTSTIWVIPSLGSWNDKISSSKAFSGCLKNYHYEHSNYGGAVSSGATEVSNLGVLSNEVSSRRICKSCSK